MERKDVMSKNVAIYKAQASALEKGANPGCKVGRRSGRDGAGLEADAKGEGDPGLLHLLRPRALRAEVCARRGQPHVARAHAGLERDGSSPLLPRCGCQQWQTLPVRLLSLLWLAA